MHRPVLPLCTCVLRITLGILLALLHVTGLAHTQAAPVGTLGFGVARADVLLDSARGDDVPMPMFEYPRESRFGSLLVFSGISDDRRHRCPYPTGLCFLDVSQAAPPTPLMEVASWPIWSASGAYFAFEGITGRKMGIYIYRVVTDASRRRKPELVHIITGPGLDDYVWSPSALAPDQLLYTYADMKAQQEVLAVFSPATKKTVVLVRAPRLKGCPEPGPCKESEKTTWATGFSGYSWSPDARFVVYPLMTKVLGSYHPDPLDSELFIVRADGSGRQQLTFTPGVVEEWPRWTLRDVIEVHRTRYDKRPVTQERVRLRLVTPRGMLDRTVAT